MKTFPVKTGSVLT